MATDDTSTLDFEVGSVALVPGGPNGTGQPAGTLHLVHGWEPLCGAERVRFVFPGRPVDPSAACPQCAAAATPRQRTTAAAARTPARSRARAS
jgi:hypothetical protein